MVDVTPRRGLMYIWALARAVSEPAKIELSTCSQLVGAEQPRSLVDQDNERGGTVGTRKQHVDLCDCSPSGHDVRGPYGWGLDAFALIPHVFRDPGPQIIRLRADSSF